MITCYMDVLGFSEIASENKKNAIEKINFIKDKINKKINYHKLLDKNNNDNDLCFSHFQNIVFTSDSIIINGDNTTEFYRQLGLFICDIFTKSSNYIFKGYNYEQFIDEIEYLTGDNTDNSFLREIADSKRVSRNCDFELLNNAIILYGGITLSNEGINNDIDSNHNKKSIIKGSTISANISDIPKEIDFLFKEIDNNKNQKQFLWPYYSLVEYETNDLSVLHNNYLKAKKNLLYNAYELISNSIKKYKQNDDKKYNYCDLANLIICSLRAFKEKINSIIALTDNKTKKNLRLLNDIDDMIIKFTRV